MPKRLDELERAKALEAKASKLRETHNAKTARKASKEVRALERDLAVLARYCGDDNGGDARIGAVWADVSEKLNAARAKVSK